MEKIATDSCGLERALADAKDCRSGCQSSSGWGSENHRGISIIHCIHRDGLHYVHGLSMWGIQASFSRKWFYRPHFRRGALRGGFGGGAGAGCGWGCGGGPFPGRYCRIGWRLRWLAGYLGLALVFVCLYLFLYL